MTVETSAEFFFTPALLADRAPRFSLLLQLAARPGFRLRSEVLPSDDWDERAARVWSYEAGTNPAITDFMVTELKPGGIMFDFFFEAV